MRACDDYSGHPVTVLAKQIAPLVALRSEELRSGTWDEIDFENAVWRVPQKRMKGDCPGDHLVPLSRQALHLLRKLHLITGRRKCIFETVNSPGVCLFENTINQGYRRMGFPKEVVTLHGVRTTFSTFANEATVGIGDEERRRFDKDWIERQLSHIDDTVRGTYNAAEYIGPRRGMMKWLADYYDELAERSIIDTVKLPAM
ncbi:tyrosine-type recombinase/integrase [Primorskyibacter sp. S187A]|uniref:tyrosine-type recombinase/integrase n=1 Tax=Primorskyibacter sp. S187A TaxID=3415130 RepID=UPI003C7E40CA